MKAVAGMIGLLLAVFVAMVGLFLVLYRGDAGNEGDIEVDFWDVVSIDADFIGIGMFVVAFLLGLRSIRLLRRT